VHGDKKVLSTALLAIPEPLGATVAANLNLEEIERLCVLLKCTPNDFFEWTPDSDNQVNEDHPLNDIRRSDIVIDITKTLNSVPLGQLAEIEQMIKDKINKTAAPNTRS
jgi:DNA-binding Xre family transcriptional regulator